LTAWGNELQLHVAGYACSTTCIDFHTDTFALSATHTLQTAGTSYTMACTNSVHENEHINLFSKNITLTRGCGQGSTHKRHNAKRRQVDLRPSRMPHEPAVNLVRHAMKVMHAMIQRSSHCAGPFSAQKKNVRPEPVITLDRTCVPTSMIKISTCGYQNHCASTTVPVKLCQQHEARKRDRHHHTTRCIMYFLVIMLWIVMKCSATLRWRHVGKLSCSRDPA
jgi:hypothetical protein